jgi:hypothetical protein
VARPTIRICAPPIWVVERRGLWVGFLESVVENLLADLIWLTLVSLVVARGVFRTAMWPVFVMTFIRRGTLIRFSASALVRFQVGDDFALVVTPARGEALPYWGPLGGVIKFKSSALSRLYDLEVATDWLAASGEDMERDLRVKMCGRRFWRFMHWYWIGKGRESPSEAACRELKEELEEVCLDQLAQQVDRLEFDLVCTRSTSLFRQDGIVHYRIFYVLDAVGSHAGAFLEELRDNIAPGKLELVSTADIERGAHDGVNVGGHSVFLLPGGTWVHRTPSYQ